MKNKLPKLIAVLAFFLLGGMVYGQAGQTVAQKTAPAVPTFASAEEKQKWIESHPTEYQQAQQPTTTPTSTMGQTVSVQPTAPVAVAGFPEYVNTGDKAKDDANYAAAKEAWIVSHPDQYQQIGGQPK